MFESDADFDLDEEFFSQPFQVESVQPVPKRSIDGGNPPVDIKRQRFDSKQSDTPSHLSMLLETIRHCNEPKNVNIPPVRASPAKKVVLRKFPGPAGLLPECRDLNMGLEEMNTNEMKQNTAVDMDAVCSQMSVKAFQEGPWEKMCKDFRCLPDKYNIAWIKSRARANKLINQKAPFLAAIIQNIESLSSKVAIVTMLLKDATGQIHSTIVHDLYEEYIEYLTVGSVIVLKQFSVLTTDRGSNHYLTITANNLVSIYSQCTSDADNDTVGKVHIDGQSIKSEKSVNVTIQKFSIGDFLKNINEIQSRHKAALLEQKLNPAFDFDNVLNSRAATELYISAKSEPMAHLQRTRSGTGFASPRRTNSSPRIATNGDNSNVNLRPNLNKENTTPNKEKFNFKARLNRSNQNQSSICYGTQIKALDANKNGSEIPVVNETEPSVKCSQISIASDSLEHNVILQSLFEGVDADSLFEDF